MPRKDFSDKRVAEKQAQIKELKRKAKSSKKGLKQSKREVKQALNEHSLGWTTRGGKEL